MGPVQTAWMRPGKTLVSQEVSKNRQSHIYELDFNPNGTPYRAFVRVFGPHCSRLIIGKEIRNLWRVGRLFGSAVDGTGTHYIVMKKEGYFFNEPPSMDLNKKTKKKLIKQARLEYFNNRRMVIG